MDTFNTVAAVVMAFLAAAAVAVFSYDAGQRSIERDCRTFGKVAVRITAIQQEVYACTPPAK